MIVNLNKQEVALIEGALQLHLETYDKLAAESRKKGDHVDAMREYAESEEAEKLLNKIEAQEKYYRKKGDKNDE